MTSSQKRIRITLLAVSLAVASQELRLLSRQESERQNLLARHDRLHQQFQRLQTETGAAGDELTQARQELAQLEAENQSANTDREVAIRAWLRKSRYFQDLFAHRPDQAIPELQLLTPLDWLRLSHEAKIGNEREIRQGLAAMRTASTRKFMSPLGAALKKYTDSHDGILPLSSADLAPYLDAPIDPGVLARYEMLATGKMSEFSPGRRSRYVITQSAPIDADYDYRDYAGVPPYGSASNLWRTDELSMEQRDAIAAYAKDTGNELPQSNDWISYVSSPSIREILLGLEEYRKSHSGQAWPERASQILPLLTSPEAKAKAEKMWPEELAP